MFLTFGTRPSSGPALRYGTLEEMDEIKAVALQQGHGREGELGFLFDHRKVFSDEANG